MLLQDTWWHPPALGPQSSEQGGEVPGHSCFCTPPLCQAGQCFPDGVTVPRGHKHLCSSESPAVHTLLPLSPFITLCMSAVHMEPLCHQTQPPTGTSVSLNLSPALLCTSKHLHTQCLWAPLVSLPLPLLSHLQVSDCGILPITSHFCSLF